MAKSRTMEPPAPAPPAAVADGVAGARSLIEEKERSHRALESAYLHELQTGERVEGLHLLERTLGLERHQVEGERARVAQVVAWQERAGTSEDRAAAAAAAKAAGDQLDRELPGIMQEIAKLTARRAELEQGVRAATAKVEAMTIAQQHLRKLVPQRVRDAVDFKMRDIFNSPENRELVAKRQRVEEIKTSLKVAAEKTGLEDHIQSLHLSMPERGLVRITVHDLPPDAHNYHPKQRVEKQVNLAAWQLYVQEIREQLPELEARVEQLGKEISGRVTECERELDFYGR